MDVEELEEEAFVVRVDMAAQCLVIDGPAQSPLPIFFGVARESDCVVIVANIRHANIQMHNVVTGQIDHIHRLLHLFRPDLLRNHLATVRLERCEQV